MKNIALLACLLLSAQRPLWGKLHTENSLLQKAKTTPNPTNLQIATMYSAAELEAAATHANFAPALFSNLAYNKTNEKPLSQMSPVFSPTSGGTLGITKPFQHGLTASLSTTANQKTSLPINIRGHTHTNAEVKVTMDLWKNLLGKLDKTKILLANSGLEKAKAMTIIQKKAFQVEIRKIYWSLIANRESQKYAKSLLRSARKQMLEAGKRLEASIGSQTEVARLKAQVTTRQNVIASLNFDKVNLQKALIRLIPALAESPIELAPVNIVKTIQQVKQCANVIKSRVQDPLSDTAYKPLLLAIEKSQRAQKVITSAANQMDLKLTSSYQLVANGDNAEYSSTFSDMPTTPYNGYAFALQLRVPIGEATDHLQRRKLAVEKSRFESEKLDLMAQLASQQAAIIPHVGLMFEALRNQKQNTNLLQQSVNSVASRYKQARLSLLELIREQDALQDSQLQEINTNLRIIVTLLDHLKVFTELPCTLNKPIS